MNLDSANRQLEAVDSVLNWKGTGLGRVETIQERIRIRDDEVIKCAREVFGVDCGKHIKASPKDFADGAKQAIDYIDQLMQQRRRTQ